MVRYTLLRILIFFGCIGLLWLVGLRSVDQRPWLLVGAAVLSTALSYLALTPFREEAMGGVAQRAEERLAARRAARGRDEDVEDQLTGEADYR